jgi:hypothetical protein
MLKVLLLVFAGQSYTTLVVQVETHSYTDCRSQGSQMVAELKRNGNKDAHFECNGKGL